MRLAALVFANLGYVYLRNGSYVDAERVLNNAIQQYEQYAWIHYLKGEVCVAQKRHLEAFGCYKRAAELGKNEIFYQNKVGQLLLTLAEKALADLDAVEFNEHQRQLKTAEALHYYAVALHYFENIITLAPKEPSAYADAGRVCLELAKRFPMDSDSAKTYFNKAITAIDEAIRLDGQLARLYALRGKVFESQKIFQEALRCYQKAAELEKGENISFLDVGRMFHILGDTSPPGSDKAKIHYNEAHKICDKAIARNRQGAQAYKLRGSIFRSQQCYKEALAAYQAAAASEEDETLYSSIAYMCYILGDDPSCDGETRGSYHNQAHEALNKAVGLKEKFAFAHHVRGLVYSRERKYNETLDFLRKVDGLARESTSEAWCLDRASLLRQFNQYDEAFATFEEVPNNAVANLAKGVLLREQGKYSDALNALRQADRFEYCCKLEQSIIYFLQCNFEAARSTFEEIKSLPILPIDQSHYTYHQLAVKKQLMEAMLEFYDNSNSESVECFYGAAKIDDYPELLFLAGQCFQVLGNYTRAQECYKAVMTQCPSWQLAEEKQQAVQQAVNEGKKLSVQPVETQINHQLSETLEKVTRRLVEKNSQYKQLRQERNQLYEELQKSKNQERGYRRALTEKESLLKRYEGLKEENSELRKDKGDLQAEKEALQERLQKLGTEIKNLKGQLAQKDVIIQDLAKKLDEYKGELSEQREELSKQGEELKRQKERSNKQETQIKQLFTRLAKKGDEGNKRTQRIGKFFSRKRKETDQSADTASPVSDLNSK